MLGKLSFDLNPGEHAVITGASGSGKTTLLRILAGLMNYRGRVGYINAGYLKTVGDEQSRSSNESDLHMASQSHRSSKSDCRDNTISPKELLQMGGISMLFQENRLLPELSAIDNLRVALPAEWQEKSLKGDLSK